MAKTISFGNWSLLELGCSGLPSGIRKHLRRMRVPRLLITIIHHNLGPFLDDGPLIHVLLNRIGNKATVLVLLSRPKTNLRINLAVRLAQCTVEKLKSTILLQCTDLVCAAPRRAALG